MIGEELKEKAGQILGIAKSGDVVFLEANRSMSMEEKTSMFRYLENATKETGVKIIILDAGIRVARVEESI